jgi:ferredoxin
MAYVINEYCTACGNCITACPNHAIAPAAFRYVINQHLCVECVGYADVAECAQHCPAGAVMPAEEHILPAGPHVFAIEFQVKKWSNEESLEARYELRGSPQIAA